MTPSTNDDISAMLNDIRKQASKMGAETIRNNILNRVFMMNIVGSNMLQKVEALRDNKKCKELSHLLSLYNIDYPQVNEQTNDIFDNIREDFVMDYDGVEAYAVNLLNISTILGQINQIDTSLLEKELIDYESTIQYDLSRMFNMKPH